MDLLPTGVILPALGFAASHDAPARELTRMLGHDRALQLVMVVVVVVNDHQSWVRSSSWARAVFE